MLSKVAKLFHIENGHPISPHECHKRSVTLGWPLKGFKIDIYLSSDFPGRRWLFSGFGRQVRFGAQRGWGWRSAPIRGFEVGCHLRFRDLNTTSEDTTDERRDFVFATSQLCQLPGKFQSRRQELHARNLCSKLGNFRLSCNLYGFLFRCTY